MLTTEQVLEGLIAYIRREVVPVLPSSAKVMAGAVLLHNAGRVSELIRNPRAREILQTIDLISPDGNIDADIWCQDLRRSIEEFCGGKAEISLPLLSPIILVPSDIDTMKRYIKGELR